jgi:hypothetical protein
MGPEAKLYKKLKTETTDIIWNRIENLSLLGMPDVLGYNSSSYFFTVELKVAKGDLVRFSPHQIAFHLSHSKNTFILINALGQRCIKLFPGSAVRDLSTEGHRTGWPLADSWSEIQKKFNQVA